MAVNLSMTRGDTLQFTLTVTQSGAAYNLTGCSIRMTAKYDPTDLDASKVFVRTVGSGITVASPTTGIAAVALTAANTSSLPAAPVNLYYDIQVTDGSSNIFTVVSGTLQVLPDISITTP